MPAIGAFVAGQLAFKAVIGAVLKFAALMLVSPVLKKPRR